MQPFIYICLYELVFLEGVGKDCFQINSKIV